MKREWLHLLCDPYDRTPLSFGDDVEEVEGRVMAGSLVSRTGRTYTIRDGVPVLLTEEGQARQSVDSFAYEWEEFGFAFAREGWINDVVAPLVGDVSFFAGKTVVDAGAGSGAQTRWIADAGASFVISLELSDAIYSRHRQTIAGAEDRVLPVQCDIRYPPVRGDVDVVYCINVIQHTADPSATFRSLSRLIAEDGVFFFNIYTKRSDLKFELVKGIRRVIRILPFSVWKSLAFLITCVAWPLSRYALLRRLVRVVVPISHSFRETWLDVYDAFGGHWYQRNMSLDDQRRLIDSQGLHIVREGAFGYLLGRSGT